MSIFSKLMVNESIFGNTCKELETERKACLLFTVTWQNMSPLINEYYWYGRVWNRGRNIYCVSRKRACRNSFSTWETMKREWQNLKWKWKNPNFQQFFFKSCLSIRTDLANSMSMKSFQICLFKNLSLSFSFSLRYFKVRVKVWGTLRHEYQVRCTQMTSFEMIRNMKKLWIDIFWSRGSRNAISWNHCQPMRYTLFDAINLQFVVRRPKYTGLLHKRKHVLKHAWTFEKRHLKTKILGESSHVSCTCVCAASKDSRNWANICVLRVLLRLKSGEALGSRRLLDEFCVSAWIPSETKFNWACLLTFNEIQTDLQFNVV